MNGILDGALGETDVDCGGPCGPCRGCARCTDGSHCSSGECVDGLCRPELGSVATTEGSTMPAYVRGDGAVLLARYPAGVSDWPPYDPRAPLSPDYESPPDGWAPDPCIESGHLEMDRVAVGPRRVEMECGRGDTVLASYSSNLFENLSDLGVRGSVGDPGLPGWAVLAANGTGTARRSFAMCGRADGYVQGGGIAYCDGTSEPTEATNHLVSFGRYADATYVGCERSICSGASCDLWVRVWLR